VRGGENGRQVTKDEEGLRGGLGESMEKDKGANCPLSSDSHPRHQFAGGGAGLAEMVLCRTAGKQRGGWRDLWSVTGHADAAVGRCELESGESGAPEQ